MTEISILKDLFYRFAAMIPIVSITIFVFFFLNYIFMILFVSWLDPLFVIMILGLALISALSLSYLLYLIALILSEKYVVSIYVLTIISSYWLPLLFMAIVDQPTMQVTAGLIIVTSLITGTIGFITTLALNTLPLKVLKMDPESVGV